MAMEHVQIGTAGFGYKDWLGNFYPQFCPPADFLRCYAMRFATVELDSTFYRIPTKEMIAKWANTTPDGFRFSAKFPRTVTHEGNLKSRLDEAGKFMKAISGLGEKLGPVLLQFPASFKPDCQDILHALLDAIPVKRKLAVEFRSPEWLSDETYGLLKQRGAALCLADYPSMPKVSVRTADFAYLRLVGDHRAITEDFSYVRADRTEELKWWEDVIAGFAGENVDIFAYFNNHYTGHAPSTALDFLDTIKQRLSSSA